MSYAIGFISGFLACAIALIVALHDQWRAFQIWKNHRQYMETEYKIDKLLEELTADRSADL